MQVNYINGAACFVNRLQGDENDRPVHDSKHKLRLSRNNLARLRRENAQLSTHSLCMMRELFSYRRDLRKCLAALGAISEVMKNIP